MFLVFASTDSLVETCLHRNVELACWFKELTWAASATLFHAFFFSLLCHARVANSRALLLGEAAVVSALGQRVDSGQHQRHSSIRGAHTG